MSLRNRLVLPVILFALAVLAGCGSSTSNPVPPPTGGFSNTNFNGTYTFSVLGQDGNGTFAMAGSLVACGCANHTIASGTVDLLDPVPLVAPGSTIGSGSTYNITPDGRGTANLVVTNSGLGLSTTIEVDFVLTSSSHGLIIYSGGGPAGGGSASGTIDLQPTAVTQGSLANAYSFSLSGTDFTTNLNPIATVGAFTLDGSGNIVNSPAGVEDFNYAAAPSTNLVLTGGVTVGSGTAPGVATFSSSFGVLTFDVYAIDSTHLKLIENDGQAIIVGDVFTQPNTTIPSNLVFTMAGFDTTGGAPFVVGGLMSTSGGTITGGSEDINEGGSVDGGTNPAVPVSFGGSFAPSGGTGRLVFAPTGFFGGASFAAYPSSGGIFLMEIDTGLNPGITSGVALQQTGTSITAQGYGLNLTGQDTNGELDEIAEFTTTSTTLKGLLDEDESFSTDTHNLTGNYTVASNGEGSATSLSSGMAGMFFYVADSSNALFISTDPNQVALGSFQAQTTPTSVSNMTQQHFAMLRSVHAPHSASKNNKTRFRQAK
jgi:hypothetical protein